MTSVLRNISLGGKSFTIIIANVAQISIFGYVNSL